MSVTKSISVDTNKSMGFDDNELCVRISQRDGNTLTVETDGLYAEAIPGEPGSSGTGYPDGYRSTQTGVKTGETFPDSTDTASKRIVGPKILHRVYTSTIADGSNITDKRDVDVLYPGDLYRVNSVEDEAWLYYVITKTDGTNVMEHSDVIAEIPLSRTDVN